VDLVPAKVDDGLVIFKEVGYGITEERNGRVYYWA
jgi:hypothetical protein